jgi:LmbE family N-acetylglucosaminyl deacetylase
MKFTSQIQTVCIIVAHPDDETLWAGGLILTRPLWQYDIYTLCRASDPDRALRFQSALARFNASGGMSDLDDGPDQQPLSVDTIQQTILDHLDDRSYDLIITHSPRGEYTRHRRHEEAWQAIWPLWRRKQIRSKSLWAFAYSDAKGRRKPTVDTDAHFLLALDASIWTEKYRILTEIYGFGADSWEAQTTPRTEGFWCFNSARAVQDWARKRGIDQ